MRKSGYKPRRPRRRWEDSYRRYAGKDADSLGIAAVGPPDIDGYNASDDDQESHLPEVGVRATAERARPAMV